jgi:hypothetical protein
MNPGQEDNLFGVMVEPASEVSYLILFYNTLGLESSRTRNAGTLTMHM